MNCYMDTWTPPLSALLVLSSTCGMLLFTIVTFYSTTASACWGDIQGPFLSQNGQDIKWRYKYATSLLQKGSTSTIAYTEAS
jgi:hypothetical protein